MLDMLNCPKTDNALAELECIMKAYANNGIPFPVIGSQRRRNIGTGLGNGTGANAGGSGANPTTVSPASNPNIKPPVRP